MVRIVMPKPYATMYRNTEPEFCTINLDSYPMFSADSLNGSFSTPNMRSYSSSVGIRSKVTNSRIAS